MVEKLKKHKSNKQKTIKEKHLYVGRQKFGSQDSNGVWNIFLLQINSGKRITFIFIEKVRCCLTVLVLLFSLIILYRKLWSLATHRTKV